MRELIENTTARLSYRIATAWRYRCTFCGRHHGDRDSAALHAVVCGKNPQGLPRGVAFVRDTDSGVLYSSDAAREAAAAIKPRRVLVARYVCKYCRGSFASISGIAAHEAKCEARPSLRGCRSCAHLEHELDGGCDCGHSRCDVPDVHKVPVCARKEDWLDDLVTDCKLWTLRTPKRIAGGGR